MCECHKFQHEMHYISVTYKHKGKDGDKKDGWSQGFKLTMPVDIGPGSTMNESMKSLGLGSDREVHRVLKQSQEIMRDGFVTNQSELEETVRLLKASRPKTITEKLRLLEAEQDLLKAKADMYRGDDV